MRRTSFLNVNDKLSILTNQLIVIKILLRGRGSTRPLPCGGRQVPTIPPSVPILEYFSNFKHCFVITFLHRYDKKVYF